MSRRAEEIAAAWAAGPYPHPGMHWTSARAAAYHEWLTGQEVPDFDFAYGSWDWALYGWMCALVGGLLGDLDDFADSARRWRDLVDDAARLGRLLIAAQAAGVEPVGDDIALTDLARALQR